MHIEPKTAFAVWQKRIAAMRCRAALVRCNGNRSEAARIIGAKRPAFNLYIEGDNAMLDARAAAEGWQPGEEERAGDQADR